MSADGRHQAGAVAVERRAEFWFRTSFGKVTLALLCVLSLLALPARAQAAVARPAAPRALTVYAGDLQNDLRWAPPVSTRVRIIGYNVYVARSAAGPYSRANVGRVRGTAYHHRISSSDIGVYYYKVKAVGANRRESRATGAAPNLYVKITHRFTTSSSDQIIAANGKLNFFVPAGALAEPRTITVIERSQAPGLGSDYRPAGFPFEFLPSGLQFDTDNPALLTMPYYLRVTDTDLDLVLSTTIGLYYYDDASEAYVQLPEADTTVDVGTRTLLSKIRHFTTYWSAAKLNPHGASASATTDYCGICHGLHGQASWIGYEACIQCHGNTNSYDSPAGAGLTVTAPNIQAEFLDCADQTFGSPSTWTQSTAAEFGTDTLTVTVVDSTVGDGAVTMARGPRSDEFDDGTVDATWTSTDVGGNPPGYADETSTAGMMTVRGGGGANGLRNAQTADQYRFVRRFTWTGNSTVVAYLSSITGGGGSTTYSGGIMVRQAPATANSQYFFVGYLQGSARVVALYRNTAGASTSLVSPGTVLTAPVQLRIRRSGTNCYADMYVPGTGWTNITNQNMTGITTPYYGLVSSNGTTTGSVCASVFDYFRVEPDAYIVGSGTVLSTDIAPSEVIAWNQLSWTADTTNANVAYSTAIQGWSGSQWVDVATTTASPYSLSGISPTTSTKLRLRGNLSTNNAGNTPILKDWTVTSTVAGGASRHPAPEATIMCAACHSPHKKITDLTDNLYYRYRDPIAPWNPGSAYTYSYTASPLGNAFCWGCHGTAVNTYVVAKGFVSTTAYYADTRGDHQTGYNGLAAHDVSLPASGTAPRAWVPPTSALGDQQGANQSTNIRCLNCHYHHGTSQASSLTGYRLTSSYSLGREENLCFQCHTQTWATGVKDVRAQFNKTYKHPVTASVNEHNNLEDRNAYGPNPGLSGANRHVECVDCHNTHQAQRGFHTQGSTAVGPSLRGVWGVQPTWPGNYATATAYSTVTAAAYEWQICLKCHSYYAYGNSLPSPPSGGGGTDQSREFNPNNVGGHAVTTASRTSTGGYAGGWAASMRITCSDCHTNNETRSDTRPAGTHGSANKWILTRSYSGNGASYLDGSSMLCFGCHDYITYGGTGTGNSAFRTSSQTTTNLHVSRSNHKVACSNCHAYPPHGYKRRSMLINYNSGGEGGSDVGLPGYNPASSSSVMYLYVTTLPAKGAWSQSNCGCGTGGGH